MWRTLLSNFVLTIEIFTVLRIDNGHITEWENYRTGRQPRKREVKCEK